MTEQETKENKLLLIKNDRVFKDMFNENQMDCGAWVEPGATVGNGAKLGYCVRVGTKGKVDNESVIEK